MKPRSFILLVPAAIVAYVLRTGDRSLLQGFCLAAVAALFVYFWWETRKYEIESDKQFDDWKTRRHTPPGQG